MQREQFNINTCTSHNKSRQLLSQGKRGRGCLRISRRGFVHFLYLAVLPGGSETGASCSVVFFTARERVTNVIIAGFWLVSLLNRSEVKCPNREGKYICRTASELSFLFILFHLTFFLVCNFDSSSSYDLESSRHPTLLE